MISSSSGMPSNVALDSAHFTKKPFVWNYISSLNRRQSLAAPSLICMDANNFNTLAMAVETWPSTTRSRPRSLWKRTPRRSNLDDMNLLLFRTLRNGVRPMTTKSNQKTTTAKQPPRAKTTGSSATTPHLEIRDRTRSLRNRLRHREPRFATRLKPVTQRVFKSGRNRFQAKPFPPPNAAGQQFGNSQSPIPWRQSVRLYIVASGKRFAQTLRVFKPGYDEQARRRAIPENFGFHGELVF